MAIPSGGTTWQSDPNWSLTSPTRSKIKSAKVTPSQSGHLREATRAPPSFAKSQCGGPPTASIPKTPDQPEEPNSKLSPPCGNKTSTGISRVPPTRQQMRGPTSDRHDSPHLVEATTGNARTKKPNGVRAGRPRPADSNTSVVRSRCSEDEVALHAAMAGQAHSRTWLFQIKARLRLAKPAPVTHPPWFQPAVSPCRFGVRSTSRGGLPLATGVDRAAQRHDGCPNALQIVGAWYRSFGVCEGRGGGLIQNGQAV